MRKGKRGDGSYKLTKTQNLGVPTPKPPAGEAAISEVSSEITAAVDGYVLPQTP